eukprot:tig00000241_g20929.t1
METRRTGPSDGRAEPAERDGPSDVGGNLTATPSPGGRQPPAVIVAFSGLFETNEAPDSPASSLGRAPSCLSSPSLAPAPSCSSSTSSAAPRLEPLQLPPSARSKHPWTPKLPTAAEPAPAPAPAAAARGPGVGDGCRAAARVPLRRTASWRGSVPVDAEGKAGRLRFASPLDPYMRVFYVECFAIFCGQFAWFSLSPLLSLAYEDVGVPPSVRGLADSLGILGAALGSLLLGSATDRLGPRRVHAALLLACALPVALVGAASSTESFVLCRFLTSWLGGSFTCGLAHTSAFFGRGVVGQANGLAGGVGGTGAAAAALVMPQIAHLASALSGLPLKRAWRVAVAFPAALALLAACLLLSCTQARPPRIPSVYHPPCNPYPPPSQDLPKGHAVRAGATGVSTAGVGPGRAKAGAGGRGASRAALLRDRRLWALAGLYVTAAGTGISMNATMPKLYGRRFGADVRLAGLLAFAGQAQILWARPLGGKLGDLAGRRFGARGRVAALLGYTLGTAASLLALSRAPSIEAAACFAVLLSVCYHGSGGCNYSIIPLFGEGRGGAAGGLVGAAGSFGAALLALLFESPALALPDALLAYAGLVLAACLLARLARFPEAAAPVSPAPAEELQPPGGPTAAGAGPPAGSGAVDVPLAAIASPGPPRAQASCRPDPLEPLDSVNQ